MSMGDPKKQKKKYESPKYPWSVDRFEAELKLLGEYGLRNKRELWSHYYLLSKYRTIAREILAEPLEKRSKMEKQLLNKLISFRIVPENATLDTVLDLTIKDVLERRIQTFIFKNGLSKTPLQARQLITHGHISIRGRKITSPSYIVRADDEPYVKYTSTSPFAKDSTLIWGEESTSSASAKS
jgi:small subunit ribosomal protein S4